MAEHSGLRRTDKTRGSPQDGFQAANRPIEEKLAGIVMRFHEKEMLSKIVLEVAQ
jgi:hypothetical protein